jgi:predicted small integral membrane protein
MPEPSPASFVSVSLTLLMAVSRALSSLYDEAFVLVTTAAVVASLGWIGGCSLSRRHRLVHQEFRRQQRYAHFSPFWLLLLLSVLAFLGVMFGW